MIEKWDEQFEQHTLEKGKRHVLNFHVRNLLEEEGKFSTTIPGNVPADVRIKFENNQIKWMRCNCILAKSGKNCELWERHGLRKLWKNREAFPWISFHNTIILMSMLL